MNNSLSAYKASTQQIPPESITREVEGIKVKKRPICDTALLRMASNADRRQAVMIPAFIMAQAECTMGGQVRPRAHGSTRK
jgi:hypothetical protein